MPRRGCFQRIKSFSASNTPGSHVHFGLIVDEELPALDRLRSDQFSQASRWLAAQPRSGTVNQSDRLHPPVPSHGHRVHSALVRETLGHWHIEGSRWNARGWRGGSVLVVDTKNGQVSDWRILSKCTRSHQGEGVGVKRSSIGSPPTSRPSDSVGACYGKWDPVRAGIRLRTLAICLECANGVSQRVIDEFETVQIDKHNGEVSAITFHIDNAVESRSLKRTRLARPVRLS